MSYSRLDPGTEKGLKVKKLVKSSGPKLGNGNLLLVCLLLGVVEGQSLPYSASLLLAVTP